MTNKEKDSVAGLRKSLERAHAQNLNARMHTEARDRAIRAAVERLKSIENDLFYMNFGKAKANAEALREDLSNDYGYVPLVSIALDELAAKN